MNRSKRRYIATLAFVAAAILLVGYWLRSNQPTNDEQVQAPSQTELSRLTRITQRRSLDDITDYFRTVADEVQTSVVALPGLERRRPHLGARRRVDRAARTAISAKPRHSQHLTAISVWPAWWPDRRIPLATVRMSDIQGLASRDKGQRLVSRRARGCSPCGSVCVRPLRTAHFLNTAPIPLWRTRGRRASVECLVDGRHGRRWPV